MAARSGERVKKRIAETSVPEWLTPMKKTNVVISEPHMTGELRPVMPMPWRSIGDHAPAAERDDADGGERARASSATTCADMVASVSRSICAIGLAPRLSRFVGLLSPAREVDHAGLRVELLEEAVGAAVGRPAARSPTTGPSGRRRRSRASGRWRRTPTRCRRRAAARPSNLACSSPARMRCTQKVHFSVTPRSRTVTSGLSPRLARGSRAPVEEVEAAHLVGAVVLAVARADAARVDLRVEALLGVVGRVRSGRPPRRGRSCTAGSRAAGRRPRARRRRSRRTTGGAASSCRDRARPPRRRRSGGCSRRSRRRCTRRSRCSDRDRWPAPSGGPGARPAGTSTAWCAAIGSFGEDEPDLARERATVLRAPPRPWRRLAPARRSCAACTRVTKPSAGARPSSSGWAWPTGTATTTLAHAGRDVGRELGAARRALERDDVAGLHAERGGGRRVELDPAAPRDGRERIGQLLEERAPGRQAVEVAQRRRHDEREPVGRPAQRGAARGRRRGPARASVTGSGATSAKRPPRSMSFVVERRAHRVAERAVGQPGRLAEGARGGERARRRRPAWRGPGSSTGCWMPVTPARDRHVGPGLEEVVVGEHEVRPRGRLVELVAERGDERDVLERRRERREHRPVAERVGVVDDERADLAGRGAPAELGGVHRRTGSTAPLRGAAKRSVRPRFPATALRTPIASASVGGVGAGHGPPRPQAQARPRRGERSRASRPIVAALEASCAPRPSRRRTARAGSRSAAATLGASARVGTDEVEHRARQPEHEDRPRCRARPTATRRRRRP